MIHETITKHHSLHPQQSHDESLKIIKQNRNKVEFEFLGDNDLINKTIQLISEGNIIGWVQGRLEFGYVHTR